MSTIQYTTQISLWKYLYTTSMYIFPISHLACCSFVVKRYSSFEAFVVDGEVLDGETGWTSPSRSQQQQQEHSNNNLDSSSSTGSALRPGGRANFFFGADYASLNKARADQAAAARLPAGSVDPKAVALLGVAGSSDSASTGGGASKAQRGRGGAGGRGRGAGAGGEGAEVLALQDESVRRSVILLYISSCCILTPV